MAVAPVMYLPILIYYIYFQSNKCLESGVWSLTSGEAYQTLKLDCRVGKKLGSSEREAGAADEVFSLSLSLPLSLSGEADWD